MSDKKISELISANEVNPTDTLLVVQENTTKKVKVEKLLKKIENSYIGDEYNSTQTYAVGDYCIHDNTLYKCTTEIVIAEEWNATKWIESQIINELRKIKISQAEDTLPIGSITLYSSDVVPKNWLLCDGKAVSRTEYAELFSVIGGNYGVGDGSTTFNLPDLRGRVAVGKDNTQTEFDNLGETGGEKTHTLTIAEMPSHSHSLKTSAETGIHDNGFIHNGSYTLSSQSATTENTGGGQAHNILQPYLTINYIIKAKYSLD